MPSSKLKNALYRAALPLLAPSPRGQMRHECTGRSLSPASMRRYEGLLRRHHVLGASLLMRSGDERAAVLTSTVRKPVHTAGADTLWRVASITKMATALAALRLCERQAFALDDPVSALLPDAEALRGITLRQLLSHTSGLRDCTLAEDGLLRGETWQEVLRQPGVRAGEPGASFSYCNFGFGLIGCVIEQATGQPVHRAVEELVFGPLGLHATLCAAEVPQAQIMPISRVLPWRPGQEVTVTPYGRQTFGEPDPLRHFGHTAGSMYTDAASLSRLLRMIAGQGRLDGEAFLSPGSIAEMLRPQARYGRSDPRLSYGLGLLIVEDPAISPRRVFGHQGYAYGCADGAFFEEDTGRQLIFLNGGCSEARRGRLGSCNRDLMRFAFREELPQWK